ncbi:hypothetical protein FHS31_000853 [Sphingomonas vulcanisoli]|uniref:Uncharacterized protein n=1 Tax=Sphingomonas vulcanisoli TaxID=1658060 RepID=A0ABX0TSB0_9SPHN|nr:hypothetical protein [Sphingomonas vulcanisoli]NIJ07257.1 hypothetical protein [Sphingomonas vulcanisoli]
MLTPPQVIAGYVGGFEGLLSLQPADNGNYYDPARFTARLPQRRGMGVLVGSMRGVTAYALVQYRIAKGAPLAAAIKVTRTDMMAITLPIAIDIGMTLFFNGPGLRYLAWNRVTPSILDKCWGSGTGSTIRRLQAELGAGVDGVISSGGETVRKFAAWLAKLGEEGAARRWCALREAWDHDIATNEGPHDPDLIFLPGWNRRSESFLPGTPWWQHFSAAAA